MPLEKHIFLMIISDIFHYYCPIAAWLILFPSQLEFSELMCKMAEISCKKHYITADVVNLWLDRPNTIFESSIYPMFYNYCVCDGSQPVSYLLLTPAQTDSSEILPGETSSPCWWDWQEKWVSSHEGKLLYTSYSKVLHESFCNCLRW